MDTGTQPKFAELLETYLRRLEAQPKRLCKWDIPVFDFNNFACFHFVFWVYWVQTDRPPAKENPTKLQNDPQRNTPRGVQEWGGWAPYMMELTMTTLENGLLTMTSRCICGKVCKNDQGLNVCQVWIKCLVKETALQRTGLAPCETQEEPGPKATWPEGNPQSPAPLSASKHSNS